MARRRAASGAQSPDKQNGQGGQSGDGGLPAGVQPSGTGTTGRYLVLLRENAGAEGARVLSEAVGLRVTSAADFEGGGVTAEALANEDAIIFDKLGVAVVTTPPDQFAALSAEAAQDSPILAIEEERIVYPISDDGSAVGLLPSPPVAPPQIVVSESGAPFEEYLLGYRDAVNHLVERLLGERVAAEALAAGPSALPETDLTWGLQITNAAASRYTGKGVRVAVLDTGFDLGHPDFVGRRVVAQSFVTGETAQDEHGHGTHCIGTACGPRRPGRLPRYGVAYEAEIYVGKVLSNAGGGSDGGILAGIEWAITNNCAVISMSLGARVAVGQPFSRVFENVARRALAAGALIVAAAGNESRRPQTILPVVHPANCPSILSVGAIDAQQAIAYFSSGGLNPQGGQVDIAAPGVNVTSSWPRPKLYNTISGTSMATPHVAGIAALHAEANPDMRGGSLGWLLLQSSRRLDLPTRDVGTGLVQAP